MKCCFRIGAYELCENESEPRSIYCQNHLNLKCEFCGFEQAVKMYFIEPICKECEIKKMKYGGGNG